MVANLLHKDVSNDVHSKEHPEKEKHVHNGKHRPTETCNTR